MSSYPPPGHFLGELGIEFVQDGDDWRREGARGLPVQAVMRAGEDLGYDGETVPAGVVATFVDLVAGRICAGAAQPDWVATSDLTVSLSRPLLLGEVRGEGRVVRAGRNLVTATLDLFDEQAETPSALAVSAFGRLGGDSRGARRPSGGSGRQGSDRPAVVERPRGSLLDRLGLESSDERVLSRLSDYTSNSLGALQGGIAAVMFERAALEEAARRSLPRPWVSELAVRYLSLGRKGPFATDLEAALEARGELLLRYSLRDLGAVRDGEARRLSVATVTVRPSTG